ncbi:MAG: DUF445 domain-containing protein [Veillonellaceae bacterium]|nr:DUF445 domain-containing protein [Veillonellaceae bacterium]
MSFIWKDWNKADKTLLAAFAAFLMALATHLYCPGNRVAEGFLFCAEAALVGGIADWFAVTALFRKPLGFPYHTAILPRRRAAFVKASVTMVQKEFFSRRKIFRHLERLHLLPMLLSWLRAPETKERLTHQMLHYMRDFLLRQDAQAQAEAIAAQVREVVEDIEPEAFFAGIGRWLQESGRDHAALARLAAQLRPRIEADETRTAIFHMLEAYEKERAGGTLGLFMAGLAEALGLVDLEEAAAIIQRQLLAMADELGKEGSPLQEKVLELLYEQAAVLNSDAEFHLMMHKLKDSIEGELPIEDVALSAIEHLREHFAADQARAVDPLEEHLPMLHSRLAEILEAEYDRAIALMETDEELRHTVGHFLYDLIARSALHAQTLVGVIVESVLGRLTDEQLNHLVYDKVEPDLLWIRMNGSIVGAGIGLVMYLLLLVFH